MTARWLAGREIRASLAPGNIAAAAIAEFIG
jgi:hypothetical protein